MSTHRNQVDSPCNLSTIKQVDKLVNLSTVNRLTKIQERSESMTEKIGLFTGTFDPLTNGHLDIILRASRLFDKLYVGLFKNEAKQPLFTVDERLNMLQEALSAVTEVDKVSVIVHEKDLTVNVAKKLGVTALVRSVRNAQDLSYEDNMAYFNQAMTGVETVILLAKPELSPINSTRMRELTRFGQDVSQWVPANVALEIAKKRQNLTAQPAPFPKIQVKKSENEKKL